VIFGELAVNTRVHFPLLCAHGAAGALGARHSPRPLWAEVLQRLGRIARREREGVFDDGNRAMYSAVGWAKRSVPTTAKNGGHGATRLCPPYDGGAQHPQSSSRGLTGRSSIPRRQCLKPKSRGVLDSPLSRGMTTLCGTHRDKCCSKKFSAVPANTCIFANRSALPVSSVIADASRPATPMQLWPAASP
jgi:hypothetical protein